MASATQSFSSVSGGSPYEFLTECGFTLPSDAVITGIEVTYAVFASGNVSVRLTRDGTNGVGSWSTSLVSAGSPHTFGADGDLWGTTWTPAEINASTFGLIASAPPYCDTAATTITVYYYLPPIVITPSPSTSRGSSTLGAVMIVAVATAAMAVASVVAPVVQRIARPGAASAVTSTRAPRVVTVGTSRFDYTPTPSRNSPKFYYVRAVNTSGQVGPWTGPATVDAAPDNTIATVTDLVASESPGFSNDDKAVSVISVSYTKPFAAYDALKTYAVGNGVTSGGNKYLCIVSCTGVAPPNATYWLPTTAVNWDGVEIWAMYYQGAAADKPLRVAATDAHDTPTVKFNLESTGETITLYATSFSVEGRRTSILLAPSVTVALDGQVSPPVAVSSFGGQAIGQVIRFSANENVDQGIDHYDIIGLSAAIVKTYITADISNSDVSIALNSAAGLNDGDVLLLDEEAIVAGGKSGNTFTTCSRGQLGTTAVKHFANAVIAKVAQSEIIGTKAAGGGGTTRKWVFDYTPTEAERAVLATYNYYCRAVNASGMAGDWTAAATITAYAPDGSTDTDVPNAVYVFGTPGAWYPKSAFTTGDGTVYFEVESIDALVKPVGAIPYTGVPGVNIDGIVRLHVRITYSDDGFAPYSYREDVFSDIGDIPAAGQPRRFAIELPNVKAVQCEHWIENYYGAGPIATRAIGIGGLNTYSKAADIGPTGSPYVPEDSAERIAAINTIESQSANDLTLTPASGVVTLASNELKSTLRLRTPIVTSDAGLSLTCAGGSAVSSDREISTSVSVTTPKLTVDHIEEKTGGNHVIFDDILDARTGLLVKNYADLAGTHLNTTTYPAAQYELAAVYDGVDGIKYLLYWDASNKWCVAMTQVPAP